MNRKLETRFRQPGTTIRWTAVAIAAVLLLGGGLGYRTLSAYYARYNVSVAIPPGTLSTLPMQLGNWRGHDVPLSRNIVKATDTDDRINRVYEQAGTFRTVSMFVGYGVRLRDLQPHRPEVCYPGAGWTMLDSEVTAVPLEGGSTLPCQVHRFRRGGLSTQHITVLNYYIVDGECWPDVGQLRKKAAMARVDGHYVAQVQIACTDSVKPEPAREAVQGFAAVSAPHLLGVIEEAVGAARAGVESAAATQPESQGSRGAGEGRL